ncbi:3',5'-cyclic AMP phosphodiesterase CpdA [Stackebrandtia endophytica]|uniref:3',5'-cyclic AMP phosphodiesterase CpdA n=1 Tax=Stackebrandtia endophytica TaxID=1496996 RepID=A0A543B1K7_9ACTN|nr:metallophosphoesterase [Stackebrandtia endophytica]TQL78686.1 3',5'-cyclic AMP phosphodiesterase CpdA [Stackebrandtia endophytica]
MHITAHLSDPHLDDDRSLRRFEAVMDYLNRLPGDIDAILITGDLTDNGLAEEYRHLTGPISTVPVLHCPGNHDVRGAYREVLLDEPFDESPINRVHQINGVRFVLCDSTIPGEAPGELTESTREWLDRTLTEQPDTPTYVCFHHPPIPLGITHVDRLRQFGTDRLEAVLRRHHHVEAILCGHAHTAASTRFADRPLLVAPGIVSTANLDFESDRVLNWDAPPAVMFHLRHDDGRITTHTRFVPLG